MYGKEASNRKQEIDRQHHTIPNQRNQRAKDKHYCVAFLCAHGYGIQIGGYEDDLTHTLTEFFHTQGMEYPEISEIVCKEKIYTDCSDYDNFKKSMTAINQELDTHGIRLVVLEDFVYCDCEYTVLKLDKALADKMFSSWSTDNFEIYL